MELEIDEFVGDDGHRARPYFKSRRMRVAGTGPTPCRPTAADRPALPARRKLLPSLRELLRRRRCHRGIDLAVVEADSHLLAPETGLEITGCHFPPGTS